ncbi:MAG: hypothetical protein JSW66_04430 [Phycisphaerales bacterium]|nr:MAG: hypothetical protein JSW66_04430 [Phycisphaerales bacterium]
MSLVRWLRKNNMKVMAVVVVVLMFGFVAGDFLGRWGGQARTEAVAYIGEREITNYDLYGARQELELLRTLRADDLLRAQDLQGVFLAELLFSDQRGSAALMSQVKSSIRRNLYAISDKQINDIYRRPAPPNVLWHCLKFEARRAGIGIPNDQAGELLGQAIPQLFPGQTYSQFMTALISRQGITEQQILSTLGELLAVWQYARTMCVNEGLTGRQIMVEAAAERESIDAQIVEFEAEVFAETVEAPGEEQLRQHFDTYKTFVAGTVGQENPYGFGYKLPARARLEYIAVKLDDVRTIVAPPTQDEVGDYYNRNKEGMFTEQVRSDPNDPNSELVPQTKGYAEVAPTIAKRLLSEKINARADSILQEAKTLTEAGLDAGEIDAAAEQLKAKAGDYTAAAEQLTEKHKIKIYAGRTGLVSPAEMQMDEYLGMLFLRGHGQTPVRLSQAVFAVDELGASELGPFDVPKPRMYENIGPAKDLMTGAGTARRIMAIVRVIEAHKAAAPGNLDMAFSTHGLQFDPNDQDAREDRYSVKEEVAEDIKKLAAMTTAKVRAEEFVELAGRQGWDKAVGTFEQLYGQKDPNKPDVFRLQNLTGLRRMSRATLEALVVQTQGDPSAAFFLNESRKNRLFVDKLYALVPADANTPEDLPVVMEFKPDLRYLAIKDVSVKRLWKEDYETMKATQLFSREHAQAQSLGAIHFNPENIFARMRFKWVESRAEPADANTPAESEAAS